MALGRERKNQVIRRLGDSKRLAATKGLLGKHWYFPSWARFEGVLKVTLSLAKVQVH